MLILPAAPAAAVSGKQDDSIVYFNWRGNQAARSYARPANPKTTNQEAVRNSLSTLSKAWAGLSDSERATWSSFATTNLTRDRFGRDVTPTGLNWFIKANSNRSFQGLAQVDTAPAAPAPAPFTDFSVDVLSTSTGLEITTSSNPGTGLQLKVQIEILPTVAWTPSIQRSRLIAGVTAGSYQDIPTTPGVVGWTTMDVAPGQTAALWFTTVREADGTESLPVLRTIVTT